MEIKPMKYSVKLLEEKMNEVKSKGELSTDDKIFLSLLEREKIIIESLDYSHLMMAGKTVEQFAEYMQDMDVYVMNRNTHDKLLKAQSDLDHILGAIRDVVNT